MTVPYLNLARKWRSRNFDEIVGQEISVRILKNSLYLDQLFPVYLFSGQRGCGKTTTARVFAAAINCQKLPDFQKDPKNSMLPCLSCQSCKAMASGSHPDFIEMDAASHTGVENVRTIVDAASLLPVMGRKKIYLIDEAHMLSKAAFNAFLKILEEPPVSVLFILATTDVQKIIDTVRSRCFQLFFTAIDAQTLTAHLQKVCEAEGIEYQLSALTTIVHETEGSARDALTLLEQVRFAYRAVNHDAVSALLGRMSEELLLTLFTALVERDVAGALGVLNAIRAGHYDPMRVWNTVQEVVRAALMEKCGIKIAGPLSEHEQFSVLVKKSSYEQLCGLFATVHAYEMSLQKSTAQASLIDVMILEMVQGKSQVQGSRVLDVQHKQGMESVQAVAMRQEKQLQEKQPVEVVKDVLMQQTQRHVDERWATFMQQVEQFSDPLLISIFKQATFISYSPETKEVMIGFAQASPFLTDWLMELKSVWTQHLENIFGADVVLQWKVIEGAAQSVKTNDGKSVQVQQGFQQKSAVKPSGVVRQQEIKKNFDVSDKEQWAVANALLETFGGTLTEVHMEVQDEQ